MEDDFGLTATNCGAQVHFFESLVVSVQVEYAVGDGEARTFDYSDSSDAARLQAPPLQYVAPELITTPGVAQPAQSPASDMFSLGELPPPLQLPSAIAPSSSSGHLPDLTKRDVAGFQWESFRPYLLSYFEQRKCRCLSVSMAVRMMQVSPTDLCGCRIQNILSLAL